VCCGVLQCVAVCCVAVCCSVLHSYVYMWHDSFICRNMTHNTHNTLQHAATHTLCIHVARLIHGRPGMLVPLMCCSVMQCVAVCCSVLQCVAVCCIHMYTCGTTHSYAVTWHVYMRDTTHSHAWYDTHMSVKWHSHTRPMTHSCASHDTHAYV